MVGRVAAGNRHVVLARDVQQLGGLVGRRVDHRQSAQRKLRIGERDLEVDDQYGGLAAQTIADAAVAYA